MFKTTIEEDVRRENFTINAMYMDSQGKICDPTGGATDCEAPDKSGGRPCRALFEDALRILRKSGLFPELGFDRSPARFARWNPLAEELKSISGERIASELTGIVTGRYAVKAVRLGWKILSVIIPEIAVCHGFDQKSKYHDKDVFEHTLEVLENIPYTEGKGRDRLAMAASSTISASPSAS